MNLKFGFLAHNRPAEKEIEYAAKNGLAHVEIDLFNDLNLLEGFNPERIQRIRELSENHRISLSIHPPYILNLAEKIQIISEANLRYLKYCLKLAKALGAGFVTTYLGSLNSQKDFQKARRQALGRALENLKQAVRECEKFQVKLALENTNLMPPNSPIFYLGDNLKDFPKIFSAIKSPWLNLCLDLGHAHTNEGILPYIRKLGPKIISVHYHDNDGKKDDHLNIGAGNINWKRVLAEFRKINYSGPFLSETKESPPASRRKLLKFF